MNTQQYIDYILQMAMQDNQNPQGNSLNRLKGYASKIGGYGSNLNSIGNAVQNNLSNGVAQNIGGYLSNAGNAINNGANALTNTLNAPQNYFKGFANNALQKAQQALASQSGALGTIGNGIGALAGNAVGSTLGSTAINNAISGAGATALGSSLAGATGAGTAGMAAAGATPALTGAISSAAPAATSAAASGASGAAMSNPYTAIAALAAMALTGSHRKAAKKASNQMLDMTNQMAEQENNLSDQNLLQTQQNTAALQQQADNALSQGIPTGGAAGVSGQLPSLSNIPAEPSLSSWTPNAKKVLQPLDQTLVNYSSNPDIASYQKNLYGQGIDPNIINGVPQGLNGGNKDIAQWIQQYAQGAGKNSGFRIPQTSADIAAAKQGTFNNNTAPQTANVTQNQGFIDNLVSKLSNGISDFARGYQENSQNGFKPENLTAKQFTETTNNPALAAYQEVLRNNGYSDDVINAVAQGKNSGNKDIADYINSHKDMYQPITKTYDKNKMGRFGEAAGTLSRVLKNPNAQAIAAGIIGGALTGDPLYGVGLGYKFGNQRAMSNIYDQVLKQYGINTPNTGVLGNISANDMRNIGNMNETHVWHQYLNQKNADELERKKEADAEKARHNKEQEKTQAANAAARQTSANASIIRANKTGSRSGGKSGSGKGSNKPQNNKDWNADLAGYSQIISNPKYVSKSGEARRRFINKYGVDPEKYLKM